MSAGKGSNLCEYRKMVGSRRVSGKGRIRTIIEIQCRRVPEKGQICVTIGKWKNPGDYRDKEESVRVSKNYSGEYPKRVQSVGVPKNGRIRASTGKR